MSDIPEEIMEEARQVCPDVYPTSVARDATIKAIAQAIISAEARGMERAAKIADSWRETALACKMEADDDAGRLHQSLAADMADDIADTIRNGTEA